jgi:hypothetical protein
MPPLFCFDEEVLALGDVVIGHSSELWVKSADERRAGRR